MQLHHDVEIVAGRVLDTTRRLLAAAEVFGFNGRPELFVIKRPALLERLVGDCMTLDSLGIWLGGLATEAGSRVGFTPLFTGVKEELSSPGRCI